MESNVTRPFLTLIEYMDSNKNNLVDSSYSQYMELRRMTQILLVFLKELRASSKRIADFVWEGARHDTDLLVFHKILYSDFIVNLHVITEIISRRFGKRDYLPKAPLIKLYRDNFTIHIIEWWKHLSHHDQYDASLGKKEVIIPSNIGQHGNEYNAFAGALERLGEVFKKYGVLDFQVDAASMHRMPVSVSDAVNAKLLKPDILSIGKGEKKDLVEALFAVGFPSPVTNVNTHCMEVADSLKSLFDDLERE